MVYVALTVDTTRARVAVTRYRYRGQRIPTPSQKAASSD